MDPHANITEQRELAQAILRPAHTGKMLDGLRLAELTLALTAPRVTDTNQDGTPAFTFEPWTDGHAIGFKVTRHADAKVGYVYLNPSQETWSDGDFSPDAFVYTGTTGDIAQDSAHHFYNIDFDGEEE